MKKKPLNVPKKEFYMYRLAFRGEIRNILTEVLRIIIIMRSFQIKEIST